MKNQYRFPTRPEPIATGSNWNCPGSKSPCRSASLSTSEDSSLVVFRCFFLNDRGERSNKTDIFWLSFWVPHNHRSGDVGVYIYIQYIILYILYDIYRYENCACMLASNSGQSSVSLLWGHLHTSRDEHLSHRRHALESEMTRVQNLRFQP